MLKSRDSVSISLRGPTEPIVFSVGSTYRFVLMPLKFESTRGR
jgi:hypothetical protein